MYYRTDNSNLHYRIIGKGSPLVFLHGNNEDSRTFDCLIPYFENEYTMILIDTPYHGQSDSDIGIDYINFAKELALLITHLNLENPALIGYSDGGIIGLYICILRLAKISALIALGANYASEGLKLRAQHIIREEIKSLTGIRCEIASLMLKELDITPKQLAQINIPALIIAGDRDLIKKSHTLSLSRAIPCAELFIVPNSGHFTLNKIACIDKIKSFIINL